MKTLSVVRLAFGVESERGIHAQRRALNAKPFHAARLARGVMSR
jgi:hypothetical protein